MIFVAEKFTILIKYFALLTLLSVGGLAQAHLLPKQNATLNIVERSAFFVISVPASALIGIDDDGNGTLSAAEIQRHESNIQAQFGAGFQVNNQGQPGKPVLSMVLSPLTAGEAGESDYVVVMHRIDFEQIPATLEVRTDLFGTGEGEGQITLSAQHGDETEVAIFDASTKTHSFFRKGVASCGSGGDDSQVDAANCH